MQAQPLYEGSQQSLRIGVTVAHSIAAVGPVMKLSAQHVGHHIADLPTSSAAVILLAPSFKFETPCVQTICLHLLSAKPANCWHA
jgi:hypothetical protein